MKILLSLLFLFTLAVPARAVTIAKVPGVWPIPGPQAQWSFDHQMNTVGLTHLLGTRLLEAHSVAYGAYDFAKQGGATGTYDSGITLPKGAVIREVFFDVITAGTTSASGTMSFGANTTTDLKAALAAASWTGIVAGIPVFTAATMVKTTAVRNLVWTIATGAFTAGKVNVYVDYVLQAY